MNKRKTENLIKSRVQSFVPDMSGKIAEIKNMNIEKAAPPKKRNGWKILTAVATAAALILVTFGLWYNADQTPYTVYLDINPSIKFEINDADNIQTVVFLNADAQTLFEGVSLEGKSVEEAFDLVVTKLDEGGYFDGTENEIVLSSLEGENNAKYEKYYALLQKSITKSAVNCNVTRNQIGKNDATDVENLAISAGQLKYINEIKQLYQNADKTELAQRNIGDLRLISELLTNNSTVQNRESYYNYLMTLTPQELHELPSGHNGKGRP
ncbi:MAG TPA: hypothetical protein P5087_05845 [Eubacteriales bacterium]|nr:hypothetical protein [Eubacteriales bacterium]